MKFRSPISWLPCVSLALLLAGCGGQASSAASAVKLQGAGASFPAPLYNKWFKAYSGAHQNVLVDYQSVGSGGGVKSVVDHTVDFGASDAAMKPEDMAKVQGGVQLFPDDGRQHRARLQPQRRRRPEALAQGVCAACFSAR